MRETTRRRLILWLSVALATGLITFDLLSAPRGGDVPFIVDNLVAAPEENSVVSVVSSEYPELGDLRAPRDALLTYEQVDAIVRKAIELDTSDRRLENVIEPGDWVVIKPNIVTCRELNTAYYYGGVEHKGQVTDLRVVKSVINYLVNVERDAERVTIAEGGAEWRKLGEAGTDPGQKMDGWRVHWPEFGGLSYQDIVDEFNGINGITVDIVDINYDEWVGDGQGNPLLVPDPNGTGITWFQRPEGLYISKTLLECDKLINLPVMKTHDIPGVTMIFKNYVGTYMQRAYGATNNSKMGLHRYAGNENVPKGFIDLFSYRPTDYAIVECFWGTEGNGPQWGDDIKLNLVVAGGDPVATEAVAAAVMGFNPRDLEYLYYAAAKGFGTFDLNRITVVGEPIGAVRHNFVKSRGYGGKGPSFIGRANRRWLVNGLHEGMDLEEGYLGGEADLAPVEGVVSGGKPWIKLESDRNYIDLSPNFGQGNRVTAYAFTYIYADSDQPAELWVGADDGAKIWLNGEVALDEKRLGASLTARKIPILLWAGGNRLLVKIRNSWGDHGFGVGVFDSDGDTPLGIEYRLSPPPPTAVEEAAMAALPEQFDLAQNFPNPFNTQTMIPFVVSERSHVSLVIYDLLGRRVKRLVDAPMEAGRYTVRWDGRDEDGEEVSSGVYGVMMRAKSGRFLKTIKIMLLR